MRIEGHAWSHSVREDQVGSVAIVSAQFFLTADDADKGRIKPADECAPAGGSIIRLVYPVFICAICG
ncbi:MAG TPA: hypothetical protein VM029_12010 [Opitutaceae bacterium]|nr:hypothetical protein [Opitutaceae bacterium]